MSLFYTGKRKALASALLLAMPLVAISEESSQVNESVESAVAVTLQEINVTASADASAEGLSPVYAGGQVARGGRAGILGTRDNMDTPFSITSYTNELIQDRHARSVGDVLLNDPSVRVARGFGNFQESYFIRGFLLNSDDVAYNGLYSLLPRQYIATELFERVEVLHGASAFLSGANPGGGGIGGAINLLPKRAGNEPLTRLTVGAASGLQGNVAADVSRRFGPDESVGIRVNVAHHDGETSIDDEKAKLDLVFVGLDWRSPENTVRLSGDIGWQNNKLKRTRGSVTLVGITEVPSAPDADTNYAQPWAFSNERDVFGTLRGEYDINPALTAWAAYGQRQSEEKNSLANLNVTNAATGAGNTSRFDNKREDEVGTGEVGLRGKFNTGPVGHEWVVSAAYFKSEIKIAYAWDFFNTQATNLYHPVSSPLPAFSGAEFSGGDFSSLNRTGRKKLTSFAINDTLSFIDDTVLLTLGARRQKLDARSYDYDGTLQPPKYSKNRVSPLVGMVYKANKRWSVYGNYIEGLTQGETAGGTTVNVGQQLSPYVSKQKEIGLKYDGGHFGAGVTYFATDKPRSIVNSANVFTSSGEDQHQGLEFTMFGELSRGARVLGGVTWLDTEQKTTSGDADGKRVIGVPKLQANIGVEWDVPGLEGLTLDGRVIYTGYSYADAANTLKVPGWTRLDIGVRYFAEIQDRLVTLRARIDNVTNRDYWASVGGYPGQGYLTVGAPRTLSVSATVDF